MTVAKSLSLLGFSILGLIVGLLIVPTVGTAGVIYQIGHVIVLLGRGLCGSREVREEDQDNIAAVLDTKSPTAGTYQSLPSSVRQSSQAATGGANGNNYSQNANQMSFSFDLKQV